MDKLITVSGVTGYEDENGTAFLRLEDVARGLGFTTTAASGNEVVRWNTVYSYLLDLGVATSCNDSNYRHMCPEFIPENIFYRLAFKAKNEVAERFQAKVADEILPAIRRTGTYSAKPLTQIEMIAAMAQHQVELEHKTNAALESADKANRRVDVALNALAQAPEPDWQAATGDRIKSMAQQYELSYVALFGDLYRELEGTAHVNLQSRVNRLRKRMQKAGATFRERAAISKLHVIGLDPALKLAFDGIVRRYAAKYQIEEVRKNA